MNTICPNCSTYLSAATDFCAVCGTLVNAPKIQCLKCKQQVEANTPFCTHCGLSFNFSETTIASSSPSITPPLYSSSPITADENSIKKILVYCGVGVGALLGSIFVASVFYNISIFNGTSVSMQSSVTTSASSIVGREGFLTTNLNLRSAPNKTASSVGVHFQNAKIKVLAVESYDTPDGNSVWYKVRVLEYGCDVVDALGCGKNSPNDSDEGWMNSKFISLS